MDLVSVIIPIYNSEKYLHQCLKSVQEQSYKNLEIILIDDGSTDHSPFICDQYCKKDSRFQVQHIKNQGVSNARNHGIERAMGKYIMFIDSDDWIPDHYVDSLVSGMKDDAIDLVLCPIYHQIDEKWIDFKFDFEYYDSEKFLFLNENYFLYAPYCKIYRSNILKENQINFPKGVDYGEDLIFNMNYLKFCKRLFVTNRTFYNYRTENINSLSRKYRDNAFQLEKIIHRELFHLVEMKQIKDEKLEKYIYRRYFDTAYNVILRNHKKDFFEKYHMINSILKDKILKKTYKRGNLQGYSSRIIFLMKHNCRFILTIISKKNEEF